MLKVGKALAQGVPVLRMVVVTTTVREIVSHMVTGGMVTVAAVTPIAEQADEYGTTPEQGEA